MRVYVPERELPFCAEFSKDIGLLDNPPTPLPDFDQNGDPELSGILAFFVPEHINGRVAAQIGLFTVYICKHYAEEIVVDHGKYLSAVEKHFNTHILSKLIIPASAKEELLLSLERVGVDACSIYPDLYGLGLYLNMWQRQFSDEIRLDPI